MIYFAVDQLRTVLLDRYLASEWGQEFRGRISQVTYPDLFEKGILNRGVWIFTSLDALSEGERQIVQQAQLAARDAGMPVLNSARDALRRFELLNLLHSRGTNDFRALRANQPLDSLRFPVFVREENEHDGSLTPLLNNQAQLRRAIAYLQMRGMARHELMVVEFCETVSADGMYRKYSVFRIGDVYVPRYLHIGPYWMTKNGTRDANEKLAREELLYLQNNPHRAWVREMFELANIEYGRLDYGVREDRPQAWEINFTPVLAGDPNRPRETAEQEQVHTLGRPAREYSHRAIRDAFLRLDPGNICGNPIQLEFSPALLGTARRERNEMQSRQRRKQAIARWAAAPGLRSIGPALRRAIGWPTANSR